MAIDIETEVKELGLQLYFPEASTQEIRDLEDIVREHREAGLEKSPEELKQERLAFQMRKAAEAHAEELKPAEYTAAYKKARREAEDKIEHQKDIQTVIEGHNLALKAFAHILEDALDPQKAPEFGGKLWAYATRIRTVSPRFTREWKLDIDPNLALNVKIVKNRLMFVHSIYEVLARTTDMVEASRQSLDEEIAGYMFDAARMLGWEHLGPDTTMIYTRVVDILKTKDIHLSQPIYDPRPQTFESLKAA